MTNNRETTNTKTQIRNIILHVGIVKTASTSIQYSLFTNKMPYKYAHKYYYPKSWSDNHGLVLCQVPGVDNQSRTYPFLSNLDPKWVKNIEWHKQNLLNEIKARSFETLVVSAEILSLMSKESLANIKNFLLEMSNCEQLKITIVGYLRNPIALFTSFFQQNVKRTLYLTYADIDEFSQLLSIPIPPIQYLIELFGKENIKVAKLEEAVKHKFGPVGFFYDKFLGFKLEDIRKINIQKGNETLSQIATDLCSFINSKAPFYNEVGTMISGNRNREDLSLIGIFISGANFKLSKKDRYNHLERCQDQVNFFNDTFGINYSMEEMRLSIDNDTEPCHIPTKKNLKEIEIIFYKLNVVIQNCIIEYLCDIRASLKENHEIYIFLTQSINKLDRKRNGLIYQLTYMIKSLKFWFCPKSWFTS